MVAEPITKAMRTDKNNMCQLLAVWEASVRASHTFLSEQDIQSLKPLVKEGLLEISQLFCIKDDMGSIQAFMGVEQGKIEMLFVTSLKRGAGIGRRLITYALDFLNVQYVDVNEQNSQAIGFYEHFGFQVFARSELDGQGNEFPILHMKLDENRERPGRGCRGDCNSCLDIWQRTSRRWGGIYMKSKYISIVAGLIICILLGAAIWRGFPPFQLRSTQYPGLLPIAATAKPQHVAVKIVKSERKLVLYGDGQVIGIFKIALGFAPTTTKEQEGDGKTPEGHYAICFINDVTPYVYFYGLNYPQIKDAERGLETGRISREEYQGIVKSAQSSGTPSWYTPLGGEVGIHGGGNWRDWTKGCVAVSDTDILILKDYFTVGTPVEILP